MSVETADIATQATDATAPLSLTEGISLLTADLEDGAPEGDPPEEGEEEIEAEDQSAAEDDAPPDDEAASEEDLGEDEGEEPESPAIAAPEFWSAEEKALFAKAPPEVQQLVAAKTKEAEQRVYSAKEEAAAARKEASVIGQAVEIIDQQLGRAREIFQGKWDGVDWARWAQEAPNEALAAKFEFDAEQEELAKLEATRTAAEQAQHAHFVRAENTKLASLVPELADPKEGRARKTALVEMLRADGFDPEDLRWAGAKELRIAYEAYQWRQAKQSLSRKPAPEPKPKVAGTVRPAAAPPPPKTVASRRKQEVLGRAYKTGRLDDAVEALKLMERN